MIAQMIQQEQLSIDTAFQIAKLYYLITGNDFLGVDRAKIGFSVRDYLDYKPDIIQARKTPNDLDLSSLRLQDLDGLQNIAGLNNLQEPSLRNNQLTQLPAGIFQGLNNLQFLSLEDNQLTQLPAGLFQGLNNLRELNLRNNQLAQLPAGLFQGLNNLQRLYLENIQLTDENKKQIRQALPNVDIKF